MPLFKLIRMPKEEPAGLEVVARRKRDTIRVLVTGVAIDRLQAPDVGNRLERFNANRETLLKLAFTKWEEEGTEGDGRVYVTAKDVAKLNPQSTKVISN